MSKLMWISLILLNLLICGNAGLSQEKEIDARIARKLNKDLAALNIWTVTMQHDDFIDCKVFRNLNQAMNVRASVENPDTSYSYRVFYEYDAEKLPMPLYVEQIAQTRSTPNTANPDVIYGRRRTASRPDIRAFLRPSDLVWMRMGKNVSYIRFTEAIAAKNGSRVSDPIEVQPSNIGFVGRDNGDAIRHASINTNHHYPLDDLAYNENSDQEEITTESSNLIVIDSAVTNLKRLKNTKSTSQSADTSAFGQRLTVGWEKRSADLVKNEMKSLMAILDSILRVESLQLRKSRSIDTLTYSLNVQRKILDSINNANGLTQGAIATESNTLIVIDSALANLERLKNIKSTSQSADTSAFVQMLTVGWGEPTAEFVRNEMKSLRAILNSGMSVESLQLRKSRSIDTLTYLLSVQRSKIFDSINNAKDSTSLATYEISFTGLSYSHRCLYSPNALGLAGFGFEIGTGDGVLNMLPFQCPLIHWGLRFLVDFSDNGGNLRDAVFADVGVAVRSPLNTRKIIENLGLNGTGSLMHIDLPKLNITSGTTFDLSLFTGSIGLPPLKFYYSTGSMNFRRPLVFADNAQSNTAYFSDTQWEATMSFYWNSEASRTNRFKLDLGAGGYDIWSAIYRDTKTDVYDHNELIGLMRFLPVFALTYTHESESSKALFGGSIRLFDNRPSLMAWIKLLAIRGNELRLESKFISSAIGRLARSWETGSSSMLQLRFRRNF